MNTEISLTKLTRDWKGEICAKLQNSLRKIPVRNCTSVLLPLPTWPYNSLQGTQIHIQFYQNPSSSARYEGRTDRQTDRQTDLIHLFRTPQMHTEQITRWQVYENLSDLRDMIHCKTHTHTQSHDLFSSPHVSAILAIIRGIL